MPLACAVAVAIIFHVLDLLFRDNSWIFGVIAWTILLLAASTYLLREMMRLLPADFSAGWLRFFTLGCLSNLAVLIGTFLCGCLLGCDNIGLGGPGGFGVDGRGDRPTGIEGGLSAVLILLVFYFFLPILPIGVWITAVAASNVAAQKADGEGNNDVDPAGSGRFFLDKDE
jgi:hypothetical protein